MPILNVKISGNKNIELNKKISYMLLELTSRILNKKEDLIAITISYIDPECWFIGGKFLSEINKNSFYLNIKVTDETNTKDEKTRYIKEVFSEFERILGNLHEESYIYIEDVRATSYGFGGKTQEYRYQHS